MPSRGDDVNQADREVPADLPRVDFFHWVMVDLPAAVARASPRAQFSQRLHARAASRARRSRRRAHGARHGINDYTGWFAGDPTMAGDYFGYDGPFPPFNDSLVHHYVFTLYALSVARAPVEGAFTGAAGARGDLSGTCSARPRIRAPTR